MSPEPYRSLSLYTASWKAGGNGYLATCQGSLHQGEKNASKTMCTWSSSFLFAHLCATLGALHYIALTAVARRVTSDPPCYPRTIQNKSHTPFSLCSENISGGIPLELSKPANILFLFHPPRLELRKQRISSQLFRFFAVLQVSLCYLRINILSLECQEETVAQTTEASKTVIIRLFYKNEGKKDFQFVCFVF